MPTASVVTTCKGRLDHLQQTIWSMLGQTINAKAVEVVVVDYGCPDGCADWCDALGFPHLKAIRVTRDTRYFSSARARNVGIRHATGDYLALIDADVGMPFGLFERGIREMQWNNWGLACVAVGDQINGQAFITREAWEAVRGFDETFEGWGWEDIDFYRRVERARIAVGHLQNCRLSLILHGDETSTRHHAIRDKQAAAELNRIRMQTEAREINPAGFGLM